MGRSKEVSQNVKVSVFDDVKCINTKPPTLITEINYLDDIDMQSEDMKDNVIEGSVLGIDIKRNPNCIV